MAGAGNETETELAAILAAAWFRYAGTLSAGRRFFFSPVFSHRIIWRTDETEVRAVYFFQSLFLFLPCPWLGEHL